MSEIFFQLLHSNGTWEAFEKDWNDQCAEYGESFESYAEGTFSVVRELISGDERKAGLFACKLDAKHVSMCQINTAMLPGYAGPVMRVRFLTMSPDFDFGSKSVDEYADVLTHNFANVYELSCDNGPFNANHIKFHLRSPADRAFFAAIGSGLEKTALFRTVQTTGSWLYVTKT